MARSSSVSKSAKESKPSKEANKFAKASLVGANTVKGPFPLKVPTKSVPSDWSAVVKAETSDVRASCPCAVSTIFFPLSVLASSSLSSLSHDQAKKTIASIANKLLIDTTFFIILCFR